MFDFLLEPVICIPLTIFILFIIAFIILLIDGGLMSSLDITTRGCGIGPLDIAYKFTSGSYNSSGPLFTQTHSIMPNHRTIAVYYTDKRDVSNKTDECDMQLIVGVVLNDKESEVTPSQMTQLKDFGFNFATLPEIGYSVQATFPFKNTLSVIISIRRVYPAISKYMDSRNLCGHPMMEVYDSDRKSILFFVPLEKQDSFYVPEAKYLLDSMAGSSDDEASTVSYTNTGSFIRSEGDSIDDDVSCIFGPEGSALLSRNNSYLEETANDNPEEVYISPDRKISQSEISVHTDESEGTDSSFEKIDATEAVVS